MPGNAARYEFRVWLDRPGEILARLADSSDPVEQQESTEAYFVSTATVACNPKVRADLLDIKLLEAEVDGFERWDVHLKAEFPVDAALVSDELFPKLGLRAPQVRLARYSLGELVDLVVAPHPDVVAVGVTKRRDIRRIHGCAAEITQGTIDGHPFATVAIESADLDALKQACADVGLNGYPNVSYPRAIRDRLGGRFSI